VSIVLDDRHTVDVVRPHTQQRDSARPGPARPTGTHRWHVVAAVLALWVLAAGVHGGFSSVRLKLLREAQPSQSVVSVPLPEAPGFTNPYAVLIYRLHNGGGLPVAVTASLNEEVINESSLAPGESARIDVAIRRAGRFGARSNLTLRGTNADWTVEYAELANIHGFTRGAIEFLILPEPQPFKRASMWLVAAWAAWLLCLIFVRPAALPRPLATVHLAASALVGALFAVVAMAPLLSAFRLVLAAHTFLGGLALMAAPQLFGSSMRSGEWAARRGAAILADLAARRHVIWRAFNAVPWRQVTIAVAFVVYAIVLWRHVGAVAGGADSSGYMNGARLLVDGTGADAVRTVPGVSGLEARNAYEPLGLAVLESGAIAATYPVGLSLMIAGAASLTGWEAAADVVMLLHGLAGVILTFWLARECRLSERGAFIAALLLATSPVYLFMSLTLMSDTPSLVWVTAAVLLAWRSSRASGYAVAAGVALGIAVLIRPTNLLALVPIVVCLGAAPRQWLLLVAGGVPAALFLASHNMAVYGAPIANTYGIDYRELFDLDYVRLSLRNYVTWLPVLLTPIGVLALGLPAMVRQSPRLALMLLSWSLAFAGLYAFYYHTHETWWYLRFLLPAFPAFIAGSLWVGQTIVARAARRVEARVRSGVRGLTQSAVAAALVAVLILGHNYWWTKYFGVLDSGAGQRTYVEAAEWAEQHLPADAPVLAMQVSGTLFYYTQFSVVRWDHLNADDWRRLREGAARGGRSIYAMLFPFEIDNLGALRTQVPGRWEKVGAIEHVTVWRLDP
jgi:hypothetical protein